MYSIGSPNHHPSLLPSAQPHPLLQLHPSFKPNTHKVHFDSQADLNSSMKNILQKIEAIKYEVEKDKFDEFINKTMFQKPMKENVRQNKGKRNNEKELTFDKGKKTRLRNKIQTNVCLPMPLEVRMRQVGRPFVFNHAVSCTNLDRINRLKCQDKDEQSEKQSINSFRNVFSSSQLHQILQTPLEISDFQLGACMGSGKFGDVYLCRHKKTNWLFALKKVLKSTILQYHMLQQFTNQLKIQYSLNHPNIVKLYGHFSDDYHVFLLMEYAPSGTLMQHLKKTEQFAAEVMRQMIEAVGYTHAHQVIHRDIKPENIVLFFEDTFKLCDFGLAAYLSPNRDLRTSFCGTLDYIAPEMKDIGIYSYSVDIWGLGVLTYEILMGEAPFKEEIANWKKRGGRRHSNWNWKIQFPLGLSSPAQLFMSDLLKENPHERASLPAALASPFLRLDPHQPIFSVDITLFQ